jgi:hypothetical protein
VVDVVVVEVGRVVAGAVDGGGGGSDVGGGAVVELPDVVAALEHADATLHAIAVRLRQTDLLRIRLIVRVGPIRRQGHQALPIRGLRPGTRTSWTSIV